MGPNLNHLPTIATLLCLALIPTITCISTPLPSAMPFPVFSTNKFPV